MPSPTYSPSGGVRRDSPLRASSSTCVSEAVIESRCNRLTARSSISRASSARSTVPCDWPTRFDRETLVTISLGDLGESTELSVHQTGFATEARRALHVQGWTESLDRLVELVS